MAFILLQRFVCWMQLMSLSELSWEVNTKTHPNTNKTFIVAISPNKKQKILYYVYNKMPKQIFFLMTQIRQTTVHQSDPNNTQ